MGLGARLREGVGKVREEVAKRFLGGCFCFGKDGRVFGRRGVRTGLIP